MVVAVNTQDQFEHTLLKLRKKKLELEAERKRIKLREQAQTNYTTQELTRCGASCDYFIKSYCYIYDTESENQITGEGGKWIPFNLWDTQVEVIEKIINNQKVIILKARQNGLTWLCLAYALWLMLFRPIATILVYSLTDVEARAMLSEKKLGGMYARLPDWMKYDFAKGGHSKHEWILTNGSQIIALNENRGDSYTCTLVIVDEADLLTDLNSLLQRCEPTINAGGKLILLSRSNKEKPNSAFKKIYRAAKNKANSFVDIFLPWWARPSRTQEWYEKVKQESLANTTVLDNLYESYPATDVEALAPSTLDKRLPALWLTQCYKESLTYDDFLMKAPAIPGLRIYKLPEAGRSYRIGADPAEGNPSSDDSAGCVVDYATGEQVAVFNGKHEPTIFAHHLEKLSRFYNGAPILVERNNHGHAVIAVLAGMSKAKNRLMRENGEDEKSKYGWLDSSRGKVLLYDAAAEALQHGDTIIRDFETYNQLALIESLTLKAPQGELDDLADAFALAILARTIKHKRVFSGLAMATSKGWQPDLD